MLARFTLYDVIAVLVPGVFFLWGLVTVTESQTLQSVIRLSGGLTDTSVLIVVGYVAGLLLHGLSREVTERILLWRWGGYPSARWLLPSDHRFSAAYKAQVTAAIRHAFAIDLALTAPPTQPPDQDREARLRQNQEAFYRCYRALEKLSDLPQIFNAQYGLFRSLLTVFALIMIAGVVRLWVDPKASHSMIAPYTVAFAIGGTIVSYWQVRKRGEDFARAVYDEFMVHFPAPK